MATVDLTLAHAADTLRASAASSALARASRTNIAGTRVSDRGSMARCEGECGAGGDDDVTLTLADKSPDDSEDTVRRRVEERGSVVSRSIRRSAARARPLSHSCPSYTFLPHPSFVVPLRACASSGSRGETCVRVAIWRVESRDAWGFRVCASVSIEWKVPAPRVRVLQSEKRGRRAERQKFGTMGQQTGRTSGRRGRSAALARRADVDLDPHGAVVTRGTHGRVASHRGRRSPSHHRTMTELGGLPGAPPPPARPEKKHAPIMNVGDTVLLEMNGDKWAFIKLKRDGYVTSFPECRRRRMCPTRARVRPATARPVTSPSHPPPPPPTIIYSIPHRDSPPPSPSFTSSNRTAVIGKHKDVSLDPLIGAPFGSTYEVDMDGVLYPAEPDPPEWNVPEETIEAIDDERNNADVNDMRNNSAQGLDQHDIARLKREGKSGKEIVEMLSTNSATFAKKTAFAQEKYKKKKLRKHLVKCRARRPTARATCEAYFHKQPAATNYMRYDALGMLLALGNVGANAQPLVVETCGGLIVGAIADRMGGAGAVCAGHTGGTCNSLDIVRLMNLSDAERESIVTAPVTELMKARRRWESGELPTEEGTKDDDVAKDEPMVEKKEEGGAEANTAVRTDVDKDGEGWTPRERPEGWRSKRIEAASADRINRLASPSEGFTSLIVASPALDPSSALTKLLPLLAPSAPFCVWSYTAQPLAEALDTLRRSSSAVNLSLQEPWLRKHQVLPRRTHPTMTTTAGSGGYVLSGNVIPEAERKRQRGDDDETAVKRARTGDS